MLLMSPKIHIGRFIGKEAWLTNLSHMSADENIFVYKSAGVNGASRRVLLCQACL